MAIDIEYLDPQLKNELETHALNIMLNAFRIAQIGSLTIFSMVKGFMDEYESESGIDLVNSENQYYNSTDDYYTILDSYIKLLLHLDNNVTDEIGKTVTNNNVTFSDTIKKFGYSGVFNGTSASPQLAKLSNARAARCAGSVL